MKDSGEWGEYFPQDLCPFGYNETIAMDHFPLNQDQALENGYDWSNYEMPVRNLDNIVEAKDLPQTISETTPDIKNKAIVCSLSGKLFNITTFEFSFYKKLDIPLPKNRPDVRHNLRTNLRPKYEITESKCKNCGKNIFAGVNTLNQIIYCLDCYEKVVY